MTSLRGRVLGTVIVVWCWLIFTLGFLAFYPTGFDIWQNIAFFIISALIACGLIVIIWVEMLPF